MDSQRRAAFDSFGMSGVEMLKRGDLYKEINSLQIGKRYRNEGALRNLLRYYLKREFGPNPFTLSIFQRIKCPNPSCCFGTESALNSQGCRCPGGFAGCHAGRDFLGSVMNAVID